IAELVQQLNGFDPTGNWFVDEAAGQIKGGNRNMRYDNMRITQTNTENRVVLQVQFVGGIDKLGLNLITGIHNISVTNRVDGCEYDYILTIDCKVEVPENGTVIDTMIFREDTQTICIDTEDLPGAPISITNVCESAATGMIDYAIDTENFCVTYTGVSAGSDALCIEICDADGNCDTTNIIIQVLPLSAKDTIEVSVVNGKTETFCLETIILPGELDTIYNFCEENAGLFADVSVLEGTPCIEYTGNALGQDEACIVICDVDGVCDTTIFLINVTIPPSDTVDRDVILTSDTLSVYCFDLGDLSGNIVSFDNVCRPDSAEIVEFTIDTTTFCVDINPLAIGQDTACLVACDEFGVCDTTILAVTVMPGADDLLPIAVDDDTLTRLNTPVIIDLIANDTFNGDTVEIGIIDLPQNGTTFINPDNSVTYAPDNDFCAVERDSFTYFISNGIERDTATVTVQVLCEDITVYNGFSPNGDGVNDRFTILGIETFPDNEVTVFNRWGNEVFNQRGYTNSKGWDGTWNGNLVPDGTYFYVIDKGDGTNPISGYIFLQR
ncbi:MAG: gliding motility-associated C-terminal domain-containing protein, partial [Saprospiraceae bacterium]